MLVDQVTERLEQVDVGGPFALTLFEDEVLAVIANLLCQVFDHLSLDCKQVFLSVDGGLRAAGFQLAVLLEQVLYLVLKFSNFSLDFLLFYFACFLNVVDQCRLVALRLYLIVFHEPFQLRNHGFCELFVGGHVVHGARHADLIFEGLNRLDHSPAEFDRTLQPSNKGEVVCKLAEALGVGACAQELLVI